MNIATALLSFSNLLEVAHMTSLGRAYEQQEALVELCRSEERAFVASMPMRHRFVCRECGVEATEVELHFEDPKRTLLGAAGLGMWGTPSGRHFDVNLSALHQMLSHSLQVPDELVTLLAGVQGDA